MFPFLSYLLRCNGGSCIKMVIRSIFWCNHFICQWYVLLYYIQLLRYWSAHFVLLMFWAKVFHFLLKFWASFSTFLRCLCKFFVLIFDENVFIWSFRKYPQYYELEVVVMLYMKIYFPRFCLIKLYLYWRIRYLKLQFYFYFYFTVCYTSQ